jgi:hypothetical protein
MLASSKHMTERVVRWANTPGRVREYKLAMRLERKTGERGLVARRERSSPGLGATVLGNRGGKQGGEEGMEKGRAQGGGRTNCKC